MMRKLVSYAALAATVVLGACNLAEENPTAGDTQRVLGTPGDAENLISSYYKRWHTGLYGSTTELQGMANVMSLMNYSSLANNCQNSHAPFSNAINGNSPGNVCAGEQTRLYQIENEVTRVASNFIAQINSGALTLGVSAPATDARNLRALAFTEFERGMALGYIAMIHDSSAIISPTMGSAAADCVPDPTSGTCLGALRPYTEVMDSAFAAFARALAYTNAPVITGNLPDGFPIPNTWLPSSTNWTAGNFTKIIRTYRARFAANVARTAAQRGNCVLASVSACAAVDPVNQATPLVNWANVIADAAAGITADHDNLMSTTVGPTNQWRTQYDAFTTWHQMPPFIIGMADNSGSYAAWIGTAIAGRGAGNAGFFMTTPDLRFPQGATRAAQNADFAIAQCKTAATICKRYFVNRAAGADQFSGAGYGWSNYDFTRYHSWANAGDAGSARNGVTPYFTLSELNLLAAEGQYRLGNYAAAGALVNISRSTNGNPAGSGLCVQTGGTAPGTVACGGGLPPITVFDGCSKAATGLNAPAVCGGSTPVPGGANCVPKVPVAPFNVVACGDLWEALKYEKRIETAYTAYANWYLDERGWGDLPQFTPLFWAVPYQDLQARGRAISSLYGAGPGPGNAPNSAAGTSTYGW